MVQRTGLGLVGVAAVALASGCGPSINGNIEVDRPFVGPGAPGLVSNEPLFGGTVTKSASRAYPISGGTLLVTRDGKTAVAADPDRGRIFLADLATKDVRSVVVDEADEVGRVVEGPSGVVYVIARRSGALIQVDVATGTSKRISVCNAPRGIAFDAGNGQVHVACASGLLVSLDAASGSVARRITLKDRDNDRLVKDDLRDVVMGKDQLLITRFRSAEVLAVDSGGKVSVQQTPTSTGFAGRAGPSTLAFRAVAKPNGGAVIVHQSSSSTELGTGLGAYYGGNCGGSVADTFVTDVTSFGTTSLNLRTTPLGGATGPLDVAISPDGRRTAIVATGNSWPLAAQQTTATGSTNVAAGPQTVVPGKPATSVAVLQSARPTVQVSDSGNTGFSGCWDQKAATLDEPGEAVAVAFDGSGQYIVQYREPARLILEDKSQLVHQILLSTDSRFDTGLALFQVNSGGGIACASCHPEGGVDGHVWKFDRFGERVTQPLQGRVSQRAPFHWSGDLAGWDSLVDEVMIERMSMPLRPTAEQSQALLSWLDTIPNAAPPDDLDQAAVARGRAVFEDTSVGCASCHTGAVFSDNKLHDVGTGAHFVVPSLVGVGSRSPLMHNGCAKTLDDRFNVAACGGGDVHGKTSQLTGTQKPDLIAYLQSL